MTNHNADVLDFKKEKAKRSEKILNYKQLISNFSDYELNEEVNYLVNKINSKKVNDVYYHMSELTLNEIDKRYSENNPKSSFELSKVVNSASELIRRLLNQAKEVL